MYVYALLHFVCAPHADMRYINSKNIYNIHNIASDIM